MNLIQKALYIFSCDFPAFLAWGIYSLLASKQIPCIACVLCAVSLFISLFQLPFIKKRLELIPVKVDEMVLRGVDGMDVLSTVVMYLFMFSSLIPSKDSTIRTDTVTIYISLLIQFSLSLFTDNAPYDIVYMIRGYAYRTIKIQGVEQILLCKKTLRNKDSIRYVVNPFRGFLIHTKER